MIPGAAEADVHSVKWIPAPDVIDRIPLDRWCAGVGPAVTSSSPDVRQGPVDSLLVISWNTHVGAGDIPGLVEDIGSGGLTDGVPIHDFVIWNSTDRRAELRSDSSRSRVDGPSVSRSIW
jgi:hypothetical protein